MEKAPKRPQRGRGTKTGETSAQREATAWRISPLHVILLLCIAAGYYESENVSHFMGGMGELAVQRLACDGTASARNDTAATAFGNPTQTLDASLGTGCTSLQKRLIEKSIPDTNTIIDATKCPDSSAWLTSYLQDASSTEAFVFLNFGCNKGYDALFIAETVSRNTQVFNHQNWAEAIQIGNPGNCYQGASHSNPPIDANLPKRPIEVHCIEAMPQTAAKVIRASETTQAKANGFHAYNYAMTGKPGGNPVLFPNPEKAVGKEDLGLADCDKELWRDKCVEVPGRTVDEFVKEHVDDNNNHPERRIPFISIDVEGYDYTVMQGAIETLRRTDYLEFEYHGQGDWKYQKLKDAVIMLRDIGFVCYWSGVNQLWKMTDSCWMEHFEFHNWSNVACVAPGHQPKLAARMEQVFEDTLVQGTATTT